MKMKFLFPILVCAIGVVGRAAEPQTVAQTIALALKDPKNAPLVIEYAVDDNPRLALPIVASAVKALPEQAGAIVGALMKAVVKQQAERLTETQKKQQTDQQKEILRAAILAEPGLAPKITEVALTMFPAQSGEFLRTALAAVPEANRGELAALAQKLALGNEPAGANNPGVGNQQKGKGRPPGTPAKGPPGGFPPQPVRPDIVSPSH